MWEWLPFNLTIHNTSLYFKVKEMGQTMVLVGKYLECTFQMHITHFII